MRFVFLIFAFFLCVTISQNTYAKALDFANGVWGVVAQNEDDKPFTCTDGAMTVSIDSRIWIYTSKRAGQDEEKARILEYGDNFLHIQYIGEERMMDNDELQTWYMFFTSADEFVWVRGDWMKDGKIKDATAPRIRCAVEVS